MFRSIGFVGILALSSACGASAPPSEHIPVGHQSAEEAAVLEAMDRYMTAISETDLEALAATQTLGGMNGRIEYP